MTDSRITFRYGKYHLDGERVPRVSDILDVIRKPALEDWKQENARKDGFNEALGLLDKIAEAKAQRKEASERGTAIHAACEAVARARMAGKAVKSLAGPHTKYEQFTEVFQRQFLDLHVARIEAAEQLVFHEKLRYAGTADLIVTLTDGRRVLADLKTGKSVDGNYALQLAGYAQALEAMGQPVAGRLIVHMPAVEPGTLNIVEYLPDEWREHDRAWKAAVRLYRWSVTHADDYRYQTGVPGHEWVVGVGGGEE